MQRKKVSLKSSAKERRKKVIVRLEEQLKRGTKVEQNLHLLTKATVGGDTLPLTEHDVERIKKEITILQTRI